MNTSNITILKVVTYRYGLYFHVRGESGTEYIVDCNFNKGWICDCPDHIFRHGFCKHMQACKDYAGSEGLRLPDKIWFDDPKSDIVVDGESATSITGVGATSHTLVGEVVKNGSY